MAGDWIKMRGNLWDDPRIAKLCDLTDCGEAQIIGGLYWLWATADQHTENGIMPGLTLRQIDRKTGIHGLGQALCDIGWLADHPEGVRIVNFEEHNGASAKKRATTAKRVADHRNADVTPPALQKEDASVTGALAREEKEKEKEKEKKETTKSKAESATATRLPADWTPSAEEIEFCRTERKDLDPATTANRFRDYWIAQPGAKGRKVDWPATWRNWVRNERATPQARASPGYQTPNEKAKAFADRLTGKTRHEHDIIDITPANPILLD